jgi:type IV pilus assembly protein PilA
MASFCEGCGNSVAAEDQFCRVCGRAASAGATGGITAAPQAVATETSTKAIVSLICGLFFILPPVAIVAIVYGHRSLSEIRKSGGRLKGDGLAMAGLILGYMGAGPMLLIIAAIAIPNLLRARMAANESAAVAAVRTLNTAEISYAQENPEAGYTCALTDLKQLIDGGLASGQKYGYVFELTGCSAGTYGKAKTTYRVVAYPLTANQTGVRAFCSDESAVIKVDSSGSARGCLENGSVL